jgi:Alpha/beta hydrolase family
MILSAVSKRKAAEQAFRMFCTPQRRTRRKKIPAIFSEAEKVQLTFYEQSIHGYRWRNHPSDKKVLILHGFESSIINFDRYIEPLLHKGYEVLAFDAPAHGKSGGRSLNAREYKDFILFLYRQFGPIQSFIAHSFGGLALCLAFERMTHDDKTKIVLIAPATETVTAIEHFFQFLHLNNAIRPEFDQQIANIGGHQPGWYSIARIAPHLKAQVLFLQDKEDQMTPFPDVAPIIDKHYPNFRFIISEGLGHRRIYKSRRSINSIMDFL